MSSFTLQRNPGIVRVGGRDGMQLYRALASMVDLSVSHSHSLLINPLHIKNYLKKCQASVLNTDCTSYPTLYSAGLHLRCFVVKNVEIHREKAEEVGHASYLHARSHDIEIAKSPAHRCCSRAAGSPATVSAVRMETKCTRGCPRVM